MQLSIEFAPKPAYRPLAPMEFRLLELMQSGWLSPLDALQKANCLSLSQRAGSLLRAGYPIEKRWLKTDSGKSVRQYRIAP